MGLIPSFLLWFSAVIGAGAFAYLILLFPSVDQICALFGMAMALSIALMYGGRLLYQKKRLFHQLHTLQQGVLSFSPHLEVILLKDKETVLWTTHPNRYPTLTEFNRKLFSRIASLEKVDHMRRAMDQRTPCDFIVYGQGNGLSQDQKWWIFSYSPFEEDKSMILLKEVTPHFDGYHKTKKNYAQLEQFLDKAPFAIFYTSGQGKILGVNQTFCDWVGGSASDIIGQPLKNFVEESKNPKYVRIIKKQGGDFNAFLFVAPQDPQTRLSPSLLCKIDLSLESDEGESPFLDAVIPALILNQSGMILSCNRALTSILGKNYERSLFIDLISPSQREEVFKKLKKSFDQKLPLLPFELNLVQGKLQVTVYFSRPYRKSGQEEVILQFIDISEQKRLEDQFIQSQKMQAVGQLAGGIAHDFNNLLTAMIGYSDLLLHRYLPNDPSYTDVMQIKQNANRAANLVRQLLAFSRRQTLQPKIVNITDHLVEISTLLRRLIGAGIELKMSHARDIWPVKVDVGQFEQVIINLAVNARDAMKKGGELTIQTSNIHLTTPQHQGHDVIPKGEYVSIDVIDTGHGIAQKDLPYIFEPFFSTKEVGEGTGLGLSTVYGIVKQTGGFILVKTKVNQGTTFNILFPRYTGRLEEEQLKIDSTITDLTGAGKILLVEDEDAVRTFSARALREKGYDVKEASSGDVALDLIKTGQHFDLLITDVVMPKMDGPTLCKKIRDIHPRLRTIFISGYTEDTFRKNLDTDTNIHFLPKPFTLKDLALKVKEVLGCEA